MSPRRHVLSPLVLATLALAPAVDAQFGGVTLEHARIEPAGLPGPPPAFGSDLLVDPVDVAVTSWSTTPTTWVYAADAGANQVVRWVVTGDGSAHVPMAWSDWLDGPWGIAVNDVHGHPEQEKVFVTGTSLADVRCVQIYDKWGNDWPGNQFVGDPTENFIDPRGIAVGPYGNVFVADIARRAVYEFDGEDVANFSSSTAVNKYGLFTAAVPFDVSVDLMRRVHVAANEYFPFPDGLIETYRYGDDNPSGWLPYANRIMGIDARGPTDTRYTWATNAFAELRTMGWDETLWPGYSFGPETIQDVPTSGSAPERAGGLELQRTWRVIGLDGGDRIVQCDARTYVTDRADDELQVLTTSRQSVPRPDDAVAWWKLDEGSGTLAYETLNSRHGTWNTSSGLRSIESMVRHGLRFDGGTFGVSVPAHPTLEVGSGDFTLEAWMRSDAPDATQVLVDKRAGGGQGYRLLLDGGNLSMQLDDGSFVHTTTVTALADPIDDGLWHHVAAVVERGVATRLYLDGTLVTTLPNGLLTGSLSSSASLFMGRQAAVAGDGLQGGLDELTLYHRALTHAEIASIAGARCGGKHLPSLGHPGGSVKLTVQSTL